MAVATNGNGGLGNVRSTHGPATKRVDARIEALALRQAIGVMMQGGIGAKRGLAADTWRSVLADALAASVPPAGARQSEPHVTDQQPGAPKIAMRRA